LSALAIETARLRLRPLVEDDAPFVLALQSEPSWLEYIGDRGVRDLETARGYLRAGPLAMRARHGHALDLVERRSDGAPLGICGLLKRDALPDPDLGFALLPAHWGQGYAREAAAATLAHARAALGIGRVVAITSLENPPSIRLLEAIGFRFERIVELDPGEPLRLFAHEP
jgi:RimJ/RimL family protein N-acetyltransferase